MIMPTMKLRMNKSTKKWPRLKSQLLVSMLSICSILYVPIFLGLSKSVSLIDNETAIVIKDTQDSLFFRAVKSLRKASYDLKETTPSLFNCESTYGKCKYFYPSQFFHKSDSLGIDGPGSDYLFIYERMMELMDMGVLWANMPTVGSPTFSYDENTINPITGKPFHRHNVTFVHVHKAGGTTIMASRERKGTFSKLTRNVLYNHRQYLRNPKLNDSYLKAVTKYKSLPDEWKSSDHILFAFIRDPLDRFISSIGQAMGAEGSQFNNGVGKALQSKCVDKKKYTLENSRHTIQCCINFVKQHGFEVELHFTPQAVELAFATQMYPIPISVFQFEESYKDVVVELGIDPEEKYRDGNKDGYRSQPVLSKMTSADYDDELRRQVCELYRVDVIMSRSLGWGFSSCDAFV